MPKSSAPAPEPSDHGDVVYRDGVHLRGSVLWFDAARDHDLCFLSHARSKGLRPRRHDARPGAGTRPRESRQFLTTRETARLLGLDGGDVLVAQLERPFFLGRLRLELVGSGHILGAASALVEREGERILYAGDINPADRVTASRLTARTCETLVLCCRFGDEAHLWPPRAQVHREVERYVTTVLEQGLTPVLWSGTYGTAQEMLLRLGDLGIPVAASQRIWTVSATFRALGIGLPELRLWRGRPRRGEVLLWPLGTPPPRAIRPRLRLVFLGGQACAAERMHALGVDAAFPLSDFADRRELVDFCMRTQARRVFLTGAYARHIAPLVQQNGQEVRLIGPPQQTELFAVH